MQYSRVFAANNKFSWNVVAGMKSMRYVFKNDTISLSKAFIFYSAGGLVISGACTSVQCTVYSVYIGTLPMSVSTYTFSYNVCNEQTRNHSTR